MAPNNNLHKNKGSTVDNNCSLIVVSLHEYATVVVIIHTEIDVTHYYFIPAIECFVAGNPGTIMFGCDSSNDLVSRTCTVESSGQDIPCKRYIIFTFA